MAWKTSRLDYHFKWEFTSPATIGLGVDGQLGRTLFYYRWIPCNFAITISSFFDTSLSD
jgi:hypothetical protein